MDEENSKNVVKSKMMWFNAITGLVAVLAMFGVAGAADVPPEKLQTVAGGIVAGIAVVNMILRKKTTKAVTIYRRKRTSPMRKLLLTTVAMLPLGACATLEGTSDFFNTAVEKGKEVEATVMEKTAKAMDLYCEKVPVSVKDILKQRINAFTTKYTVEFVCTPKAPE